jgi:ABC-type polysaccharide/polyol phosphate transport system ATPase subunit
MELPDIDFTDLKTSWTKYDIVHVLDVVYSIDTIKKYKKREAKIDEPILRSFLGIRNLNDNIPKYWILIQDFPSKEKKIFALLTAIFTNGRIVKNFAEEYSTGNMQGVLYVESGSKEQTNLRSALVVSEVTDPSNRREKKVPYDFSSIFYYPEIGRLFKEVLRERFSYFVDVSAMTDSYFYNQCFNNEFHKALSLTENQFKSWLEGHSPLEQGSWIKEIDINSFLSIEDPLQINFENSKEIYLLGENGDGKSLLLMAIYLAFNGFYIENKTETEQTGHAFDLLRKNRNFYGLDNKGIRYDPEKPIYMKNLYAYGTHRGRYSPKPTEMYGFMSLFDNDLTLSDPGEWIKDIQLEEKKGQNRVKVHLQKLQELINNILERNVQITVSKKGVKYTEKGYETNLLELSEGYRSIIVFLCDLLIRLCNNNRDVRDVFSVKAVVLVDEIDQHLHLKWQRTIVKKLRTIFPNIQFIFTTHSPSIIQGASDDAILFRTYRIDGRTHVSAPYYRKDLNNFMMNTLVTSSLFGLDDSRLDSDNNMADTSDDYYTYKISRKIQEKIDQQRRAGKDFISEKEIDTIIDNLLNEQEANEKD